MSFLILVKWLDLEGEAMDARRTKMELPSRKKTPTTRKHSLEIHQNITVIKPEELFVAETLIRRKGKRINWTSKSEQF